jgi:hypothetical protein
LRWACRSRMPRRGGRRASRHHRGCCPAPVTCTCTSSPGRVVAMRWTGSPVARSTCRSRLIGQTARMRCTVGGPTRTRGDRHRLEPLLPAQVHDPPDDRLRRAPQRAGEGGGAVTRAGRGRAGGSGRPRGTPSAGRPRSVPRPGHSVGRSRPCGGLVKAGRSRSAAHYGQSRAISGSGCGLWRLPNHTWRSLLTSRSPTSRGSAPTCPISRLLGVGSLPAARACEVRFTNSHSPPCALRRPLGERGRCSICGD